MIFKFKSKLWKISKCAVHLQWCIHSKAGLWGMLWAPGAWQGVGRIGSAGPSLPAPALLVPAFHHQCPHFLRLSNSGNLSFSDLWYCCDGLIIGQLVPLWSKNQNPLSLFTSSEATTFVIVYLQLILSQRSLIFFFCSDWVFSAICLPASCNLLLILTYSSFLILFMMSLCYSHLVHLFFS